MRLSVSLMPQLSGDTSNSVCIVIDVLRATTCIATLFSRKCPRVYVSPSYEGARVFARQRGYALCGEIGGVRVEGFDYGNSPSEFEKLDFAGRPAVICTTNGTRAIATVSQAPCVLPAAAVNCGAVTEAAVRIAAESDREINIVCSGTDHEFTLEDAVVAGMYVERIASMVGSNLPLEFADSAVLVRRIYQKDPSLLRNWMEGFHARRLCDLGFGEDVACCAQTDTLQCVPILVTERDADKVDSPVLIVP